MARNFSGRVVASDIIVTPTTELERPKLSPTEPMACARTKHEIVRARKPRISWRMWWHMDFGLLFMTRGFASLLCVEKVGERCSLRRVTVLAPDSSSSLL